MCKKFLAIAALALVLPLGAVHAMPIVDLDPCVDDPGSDCAVAIRGLEIMGTTFDVSFVDGAYDAVFAGHDPFFLNDRAGGQAATAAIVELFNTVGNVPGILGIGFGIFGSSASVPYALGEFVAFDCIFLDFGGWSDLCNGAAPTSVSVSQPPDLYFGWAVFRPQIPEPGTLALVGLGVAAWRLRR